MRVVPPPDHLHGDGRGIPQRPEDDAVAPILGSGALGSDPDAAARSDDRKPVVDVVRFADLGPRVRRPQVRRGGPGARVDQQVRSGISSSLTERLRAQGSSAARAQ
jgi:hypothetical protein